MDCFKIQGILLMTFWIFFYSCSGKTNREKDDNHVLKNDSINIKQGSAILKEYFISDSCTDCSGSISLLLIEGPLKKHIKDHLNKVIKDHLIGEPDSDQYLVEDFLSNKVFGVEKCIGISTQSSINFNKNGLLSLVSLSEGVCGTSVGDYFPPNYVNIDLTKGIPLELEDIIIKEELDDLALFVSKYSEKHKVDNVPYICGDCEGEDKHDQRKMRYLKGLSNQFYIKDKVIGFYTLIHDENPPDGYRRGRDKEVGEEYMRVEIPIGDLKNYIKPEYLFHMTVL